MNQVLGPLHSNVGSPHHVYGQGQAFASAAPQPAYYYHGAMHSAAQQQPQPYTTAPFSQSVPAGAQVPPGLAAQNQQSLRQSQSASPQQRLSPNAAVQAAPQHQQTPPHKYPMAAPPLPQSPAVQQQAAGINSASSPKSPQSPGSQNREQQRVTLLLEINVELLQEVNRLQAEGKGGAISAQQMAFLKSQGQPANLASEEYISVLRRVQANLGYLMPVAQQDPQKIPRGPGHMTPPSHMPQLQSKYDQLRELFPGWSGNDGAHRLSQSASSPQPNGMSSANGVASPSTAAQA